MNLELARLILQRQYDCYADSSNTSSPYEKGLYDGCEIAFKIALGLLDELAEEKV